MSFYDVAEAEIGINSAKAKGGSDAMKVSLLPNLHFLRTFVRYRGMMNMSQKLFVQLLLGFVISSLYLAAFLLTPNLNSKTRF